MTLAIDEAEAFHRVKIRALGIVAPHRDRADALSSISCSARIDGKRGRGQEDDSARAAAAAAPVIAGGRRSGGRAIIARPPIVSSAGLVVRGEKPFRGRDPDYRVIPSETRPDQLMFSHISINLDRSGFQEDWNVVFPFDRLRELAADGVIGSVAATHYSFMGATDPVQMEPYARDVASRLKADGVDAVLLSPV